MGWTLNAAKPTFYQNQSFCPHTPGKIPQTSPFTPTIRKNNPSEKLLVKRCPFGIFEGGPMWVRSLDRTVPKISSIQSSCWWLMGLRVVSLRQILHKLRTAPERDEDEDDSEVPSRVKRVGRGTTHSIRLWYICLHLVDFLMAHIDKYTIHGWHGQLWHWLPWKQIDMKPIGRGAKFGRLGGGFQDFLFSSLFGEDSHFD